MNIGIVTVWRERGAGVVSEQFARALNENGARVFVFSRGGERGLPSLNCRFVESVRESKPVDNAVTTFFLKSEFLEWINRNSISAVLFNEQHWWPPVLWCREIGVRCGAYVDYYKEDTIPLFGLYDFLVCNTKRHYRAFNWHQGAIYVPWGTDIEAYSAKGAGVSSSNGVRFLHSAGMSPMRKGTDILIRAAKRLRGNYQLLIHTQADNVFSDDNRIRIINSPMSMRDFYPMGDVYVYPARLDGIGLTVPEAIASGLAIITTDYEPMSDFVDDSFAKLVPVARVFCRKDGYYWPQAEVDERALTEVMQGFVDSPASIDALKLSARAWAIKNLDWRVNSFSLLKTVMHSNSAPEDQVAAARKCLEEYRRSGGQAFAKIAEAYPRATSLAIKLFRLLRSTCR